MGKSFENTPELAKLIRSRRKELNLTIEAVASKAGVGTKTWSRYESGAPIRKDKYMGIYKALNWNNYSFNLDSVVDNEYILTEYKKNTAWSNYLEQTYGIYAAASFVIGSDILLDHIQEDLEKLSTMQKDSHIGQIEYSWLQSILPQQFLMEYNYSFLYALRTVVINLRNNSQRGSQIIAHSVIEELALYLIVKESELVMENFNIDTETCKWDEWIFDIFGDCDIITFLYSNTILTPNDTYFFDSWFTSVFYIDE